MGVHVLEGKDGSAVLYCSTTSWAFGPLFEDGEAADDFLRWLKADPRAHDDEWLQRKHSEWLSKRGLEHLWEKECCTNPKPVDGYCENCDLRVDERGFYLGGIREDDDERIQKCLNGQCNT